jgi:hypothetical protein
MRNIFATAAALVMALSIVGTTFARCGKDGECGNCNQGVRMNQVNPANPGSTPATEPDVYRQFRQNTLDLRQAMMNNRFDLQRENLKATPDTAKVAALKADITAIQAKINQIRVQSGLPDDGKRDGECFKPDGGCNKMNGPGGCNGQPCWKN